MPAHKSVLVIGKPRNEKLIVADSIHKSCRLFANPFYSLNAEKISLSGIALVDTCATDLFQHE